jgi:hypothetical protein
MKNTSKFLKVKMMRFLQASYNISHNIKMIGNAGRQGASPS